MNPYYLVRNKLDHLCFLLHIQSLYAETLADIGCGNHPQDIVAVDKVHWLVDPGIHPHGFDGMVAGVTYHDLWTDWAGFITFNAQFLNDEVECVTLMDVIEHLPKEEGVALLEKTIRHAKMVVVFTPLGFLQQEDGRWNTHRSGWTPDDFRDGWTVFVYPHFHWCDFRGVPYEKPKGAMLAVWRKS